MIMLAQRLIMSSLPILSIIIPCFNEEECIVDTVSKLLEILNQLEAEKEISTDSFLFFVDDGGTDNTWNLIVQENEKNNKVKGIRFTRNFGNQMAILAGLLESNKLSADCYITIDADLQQDETKIKEFIQRYKNGAQIVCGVRNDRKTDGFIKKTGAFLFYKLMNIFGVNIKPNHSEYRLLAKEVVCALKDYKEKNMFLRGIVSQIGFKRDYIFFDVKPRKYGKSKFTPIKMLALALNGITSFSIIPLRMVTFMGLSVAFISFCIGISAFIDKVFWAKTVSGWATIVVAIGFIGGIQILCIGIIGEYLGQLFQEVKNRPRYIIENSIN